MQKNTENFQFLSLHLAELQGWHRLQFSQMQAQKPKIFGIFLHLAEQQSINIPLSTVQ